MEDISLSKKSTVLALVFLLFAINLGASVFFQYLTELNVSFKIIYFLIFCLLSALLFMQTVKISKIFSKISRFILATVTFILYAYIIFLASLPVTDVYYFNANLGGGIMIYIIVYVFIPVIIVASLIFYLIGKLIKPKR